MIERYTRKELKDIWSDDSKYNNWLKIEGYVLESMSKEGLIDDNFVKNYWKNAKFNKDNIDQLEQKLRHDVLAFLTDVSNSLENHESTRFIHYGMTSSDVLDTCFSMQLSYANDYIIQNLENVCNSLYEVSKKHLNTLCLGRTHGIHAEATSFGLKMLHHASIFERSLRSLKRSAEESRVCKISGAVGNFAHISTKIEEYVSNKLGFNQDPVSTQIIARDVYANLFASYALIASAIENFAIEIRHLQRTEVNEVTEYFSSDQKGSSAMPHKKNPIFCENLTGLTRIIRASVIPAMENIVSWHERDISHSSAERLQAPTVTATLDFALVRLNHVISNMSVNTDRMIENLKSAGNAIFSQKILLLIIKYEKNTTRDAAYRLIQRNIQSLTRDEFIEKVLSEYLNIPKDELVECFDYNSYIKNASYILNKFEIAYKK